MTPIVSIIMGSTSDLPVMEKAAKFLEEMEIPFEMNALSAHRRKLKSLPVRPVSAACASSLPEPAWQPHCPV